MTDTLRGNVTNIIDTTTFEIAVTQCGEGNRLTYGGTERIRIATLTGNDHKDSDDQERSVFFLERMLKGREVLCVILARDISERLLARVTLV